MLTRQSVHVDAMGGETDAHVSIPAFWHYAYFEVVETARSRDRVRSAHARCVLVCFAVTYNMGKAMALLTINIVNTEYQKSLIY